jgi:hypothetical protein
MHKTLTSLAAGLLLAAVGTGAHAATNLITHGDFEKAQVATNTFETYQGVGSYGATDWGSDSTSGTHKIVDANDNQYMQFGGADSAYISFGATTGGAYELTFDYSGSGFWALYNQTTESFSSNNPQVYFNGPGTSTNTSNLTLADNTSYKLYFGSAGAGLPGMSTGMTLDNVAVTPVPEPESYAMLVAGLGMLGFMGRRRQQR